MKSNIGLLTLLAILLISGCDSQVGSDDVRTQSLELSLSIAPELSNGAGKGGGGLVLTDGTSTLDITSVGIVIREIELERVEGFDCDAFDDDQPSHDENECEEFETGPVLLEPALDGSVEHVASIEIPEGFYKELEFDIHKVGGEEDIDFVNAHPAFDGISIRVEGTFNDVSFVFTQDLDEEQEIEFDSPIEISADTGVTNITLHLDLSTWFVTNTGVLVDPAMANDGGAYEGLVEENIKNSIDVFEDDDHDGHDDSDRDSDDY
ncbi:MAG: hypothetical protein IH853_03630 [Bacteroidetes bacterium]|nr:hypothetical protein [Bacteroidota bacterium]